MTLLRIAAGLGMNGAREHRWRRVSVFVAAAVFLTFVLAAASVVALVQRETDRSTSRIAVLSEERSDADLFLLLRPDDWRGRSILVAWLLPSSANAETILPPGVTRLPDPGEAVVSPALDRLASQHPELAARYPHRSVISWAGVRSGGELFAYASPAAARNLGPVDDAFRIQNGEVVGEGPLFRIGRFGRPGHAAGFLPMGEPQPVPLGPILGGLTAGLVIPAIIILAVGAAAASETRNQRFAVLRSLGAAEGAVRTLSVLETLLLAVPGLLVATLIWSVVGPRLTAVPLVGYGVAPGDLALPWWLLWSLLALGVIATAALALVLSALSRQAAARPRPGYARSRLLALRWVPIGLAALAFGVGKIAGGYRQSDFYLVGLVLAVVAVPALVPLVLRALGRLVARVRAVAVYLTGRAMEWDPVRAARPFVAGAALLFLVLAGSGYVSLSRETEAPPSASSAGAATVEWPDPIPGDLARLRAAFGRGLVVPFSDGDDHHAADGGEAPGHQHEAGGVLIGVTCPKLAAYVPDGQCDPASPLTLPPSMQPAVATWLAQSVHGRVGEIGLVPPEELAAAGSALVLDTQPVDRVDQQARNAAMRVVPAPYVRSAFAAASRESPLVPWLIGTLIFAAGGLAFACLLALIDRLLGLADAHRRLVNLGISPAKVAQVSAWNFALPYFAVLLLGFAGGCAVCALLLLPGSSMPLGAIGTAAALGAAFGLLGSVSVALLGAKSASTTRD